MGDYRRCTDQPREVPAEHASRDDGGAAEGRALLLDRFIGLELSDASVDCCITKSPCGGEKASKSPADRGKRGIKRVFDIIGIILIVLLIPVMAVLTGLA
jgi:hypothetical protein